MPSSPIVSHRGAAPLETRVSPVEQPISTADAGAILSIDLGAIRTNYRKLKSVLGATACAGVVKADAYGLGAIPVARALVQEGCSVFFVAHVAEGMALRTALGRGPTIQVLNGLPAGSEADAADAGLIPVLNSLAQIDAWRALATARAQKLPATLQIDSGMSRLGLQPSDVDWLAGNPQALNGLAVELVMSHLACADEPDHPANAAQLQSFEALRARLPAVRASLANSSGIFLGKSYHHDLARPGAALYGINPTPGQPNPMVPVLQLCAKVIQTRMVPPGAGVGYGHSLVTGSALATATISLGYADGWPRRAGVSAWYNGIRLPFAGRVSMDSIILDITALPEGALKEHDLVELIGEHQGVDELAASAGTIGYEILTGLGHRFHRDYSGG